MQLIDNFPLLPAGEVIADVEKSVPRWLRLRNSGIGASEIGALLGLDPYCDQVKLWKRKTGREKPFKGNPKTVLGKELEGWCLDKWEKETGFTIVRSQVLVRSREHPFLLATPDGFYTHEEEPPLEKALWGVVEVKTTGRKEEWRQESPPGYVLSQVQQQMLVTGLSASSVVCLFASRGFEWRTYEGLKPDPELHEIIIKVGKKFWWYVEHDQEPPQEGNHWHVSDRAELRSINIELQRLGFRMAKLKDRKAKLEGSAS